MHGGSPGVSARDNAPAGLALVWKMLRGTRFRILGVTAALAITVATADAQRGFRIEPNVRYDGRVTFVRLRYTNMGPPGWAYDYPAMERNFMSILGDLTTIRPRMDSSNIITMDDPELLRYPVAYLSEPGYWLPNEREVEGLRTWLHKGGFLIVDDFLLWQWNNFERQMLRVLPGARIVRLGVTHPVFQSFFALGTLDGMAHPDNTDAKAEYFGIFEDNDPHKRLMVIVNYNNDIGDYMEWTGQGWYAVNLTNDAYKLATNYLVYGLTH